MNRQDAQVFVAEHVRSSQPNYILSRLFLAGYVFTVVAFSETSPQTARYSQLMGFALTGAFIAETLRSHRSRIILPPELIALTAFTVISFCSAFWAVEPSFVMTRSKTVLQLLIFFLVAVNIMVQLDSIMPVVVGLLVGQIYAVIALVLESGISNIFQAGSRSGGVLVNANAYGICLTIGILVCLYLYSTDNRHSVRAVLVLLMLVFVQQIVFVSGSRKAILGVVIVFIWFLISQQILSGKFTRGNLLLLQVIPLLLYLGGDWLLANIPFMERFTNPTNDPGYLNRLSLIEEGFHFWQERALFGYGTGNFAKLSVFGVYSHCNYVELLVNNGIIGFCIYYSTHLILLRRFWKKYREGASTLFLYAWAAISVGLILFWDIAMVSYFDKLTWVLLMLLSALSLIQTSPAQTLTVGQSGAQIA